MKVLSYTFQGNTKMSDVQATVTQATGKATDAIAAAMAAAMQAQGKLPETSVSSEAKTETVTAPAAGTVAIAVKPAEVVAKAEPVATVAKVSKPAASPTKARASLGPTQHGNAMDTMAGKVNATYPAKPWTGKAK
jgi:hypothetical protein